MNNDSKIAALLSFVIIIMSFILQHYALGVQHVSLQMLL